MTAGLVIVGAGICGVSAAHAARDAGYDRRITLIGDEDEWPYERPPLSKWGEAGPELRPISPPTFYEEAGIDFLRGKKVSDIDLGALAVVTDAGQRLRYDKLLLATGASAREIPLNRLADVKPHYLRDHKQALSIAAQITEGTDVLIIGGGFIGLELAASLAARRCFVHVIEMQDRILARAVPAQIAQKIRDLHQRNGVTLHTGTQIVSLREGVATLSNGLSVRASEVIVGAGSVPRTELAEAARLRTDNGIIVDTLFRTSAPDVFAAGDCCAAPVAGLGHKRFESWQVAADQGRRVGQIIAGRTPEASDPPWFWSDQYDHGLQVVGLPPANPAYITRPLPKGGTLCIAQAGNGQITYAAGFAPGALAGREIKLIQRLMQAGIALDPRDLQDPDTSLKSILKQGQAVLNDQRDL